MECDKNEFQSRLNKISGQISAIERMYDEKRSAEEIIQQLVAVRSSLGSLARVVVEAELKGCLSGSPSDNPSRLIDTLFKVS